MTHVSALPFMVGIAGGVLLFGAWLPLAVQESRRPYRWRETRPAPLLPPDPGPRIVETAAVPRHRHPVPSRVAIVVAAFTVWSLWSLRSRSDHR